MHDLVAGQHISQVFKRKVESVPTSRPASPGFLSHPGTRDGERDGARVSLSVSLTTVHWSLSQVERVYGPSLKAEPGELRHVMRIELLTATTTTAAATLRKLNSLGRQFTPEVLRSDLAQSEVLHSLA